MKKLTLSALLLATSVVMGAPAMADWTCEPLIQGISSYLVVTSVSASVINAKEIQGAGKVQPIVFTYDAKRKAFEYPSGENTYEGITDIKSYKALTGGGLQLAIRVAKDTAGYVTTDINCK